MGTVTINVWQLLAVVLAALWCGLNIGHLLTDGRKEQKLHRIKSALYANGMAFKATAEECEHREDDVERIFWKFHWEAVEAVIKDAGLMDDFLKMEKEFDHWRETCHGIIKDRDP